MSRRDVPSVLVMTEAFRRSCATISEYKSRDCLQNVMHILKFYGHIHNHVKNVATYVSQGEITRESSAICGKFIFKLVEIERERDVHQRNARAAVNEDITHNQGMYYRICRRHCEEGGEECQPKRISIRPNR